MTDNEFTQCLNLARALNLIASSGRKNGRFYVYDAVGQAKLWDSFVSEYPLERLQAMVSRAQLRANKTSLPKGI
jgi:hypothetical protein